MKIAYLILAHKNPAQLARLIGALSGQNVFYIHIDRKVSEEEFRCALRPFQGYVHFAKDRFQVNWGGFSQVEATLSLIRECLSGETRIDRAILLSGQDYPIKPSSFIQDFLLKAAQTEFIQYWEVPSPAWKNEEGGMDRIQYYWLIDMLHLRLAEKLFRFQKAIGFKRALPGEGRIFGGSNWFMLTEPCLRFIARFLDSHRDFIRFWRTTRCSDEMFFNTLVMNSQFAHCVTNNIYRQQNWAAGPEYPRILRTNDFDELADSPNLFARKFDMNRESSLALLERIDKDILSVRYA